MGREGLGEGALVMRRSRVRISSPAPVLFRPSLRETRSQLPWTSPGCLPHADGGRAFPHALNRRSVGCAAEMRGSVLGPLRRASPGRRAGVHQTRYGARFH